MARKPTKPVDRVMAAADAYSLARAEANWSNGYRARFEADPMHDIAEADRLFLKERAQWKRVGVLEKRLRRVLLAALRSTP